MQALFKLLTTGLLLGASALAVAKLPPLSDEAKAKAAEAAAKAAWSGKVEAYQLCKSQDQAAASYYQSAKAAGKETKPAMATPACAEPGPFAYSPPEAAGAGSPAATATSPVGSKPPDAAANPAKKP